MRGELAKLGASAKRRITRGAAKSKRRMWNRADDRPIPLTANSMANDHIKKVRRGAPLESSWFDVRDAYLAGFTAGWYDKDRPASLNTVGSQ